MVRLPVRCDIASNRMRKIIVACYITTGKHIRLFVLVIFPMVLRCCNYRKLKVSSYFYLIETGQAAESSMMNPVSDEERDATPSDTDSSGKQEKRSKDTETFISLA